MRQFFKDIDDIDLKNMVMDELNCTETGYYDLYCVFTLKLREFKNKFPDIQNHLSLFSHLLKNEVYFRYAKDL